MKKKIAMALSLVLSVLMLGACGSDSAQDYNGKSADDLSTEMDNSISNVQTLAELYDEYGLSAETLSSDDEETLLSYGLTEAELEAADSWLECAAELGDMQEILTDTFTVTKSGKTLTTDETIVFADRSVNFEVVYDYYSMEVTGISIDPIYTVGEKMGQAAINTVISISVVFAVLILISLIIYCFKIFPYLEEKKKAKERAAAMPIPAPAAPAPAPAPAAPAVDSELAAVIAAAIAASAGKSTSDFVVRSINRR